MKKLLCVFLFATSANAGVEYIQAVCKIACWDPFREVNGTIYDVTPIFDYVKNGGTELWRGNNQGPWPLPDWTVFSGTVTEVIGTNGLLITSDHRFTDTRETIRIKNYPNQDVIVDGKPICGIAMKDGRYQFRDVRGSISTVRSLDWGTTPAKADTEALTAHKRNELERRAAEIQKQLGDIETRRKQEAAALEARKLAIDKEQAAKGYPSFQYELAKRYLEARGVDRDEKEARRLLQLSADQGYAPAKQKLEALQKDLVHK